MIRHQAFWYIIATCMMFTSCYKDEAPALGTNLLDHMDPDFIGIDSVKVTGTSQKDLVFYLHNGFDRLDPVQQKLIASMLAEINVRGVITERTLSPNAKSMVIAGRKPGEQLVFRFAYFGVRQQVSKYSASFTYVVP